MATQLKVKKLHPKAVIPSYAKLGDAGLDLTVTSTNYDAQTRTYTVGYGIAVEIPEGHVGLLFPRSSIYKKHLTLSNCVGVIDSGYRGEIKSVFYTPQVMSGVSFYTEGERAAQLIVMPIPQMEIIEATDLSSSDRGTGGFGSSGN